MPGNEDLIRIMDASLEKSEIREVITALGPLKEEIKSFSGISIFTKDTKGAQEFRQQAEQLETALKRLKTVEQELEDLRSKNTQKAKERTAQEVAASQEITASKRREVAEIRAQDDAYKQLTLRYAEAAAEAKKLSAEFGVNSTQARAANREATELAEKIQKIAKAAGDSRTGIGRYTEGIKEGFKDMVGQAAQMVSAFYLVEKAFDFIKDSIKAFMESEAAASRLKNILSNIGREDVLKELNKESKELSETLGTVAQKDVTETFQKLITYGKLTKNQILELTPVIADFAAKQRIDMPEATSVITKALEGNSRALKEYGINVKDGSNAQERFTILMDELKPRVDGAAKAFGETMAGGMKKAEIATEELKVQIGEEFSPTVNALWHMILDGVKGLGPMMDSWQHFFESIADGAAHAYAVIKAGFGSTESLLRYEADKKARETLIQTTERHKQAEEEAESFRKKAAKESLTDQAHELNNQKALLQADLNRYKTLAAMHQMNSDAGKQATDELYKQNEIVKALTAQYNSTNDNGILGFGDQSKPKEKKEKKAKEEKRTPPSAVQLFDGDVDPNIRDDEHKSWIDGISEQIKKTAELFKLEQERAKSYKASEKEIADEKKKTLEMEIQAAEAVGKAVKSFVLGGYESQINAIQKTIDLNNQKKEKETKAIQSSSLSIQEKAAAEINLNAQVEASNEALHRKQRDLKIKEAQFDRAAAILEIAEKTAIAVMAQYANGDGYTATARAIAVGAVGAAEIAAIIAKPIPQYAGGVLSKPTDGPMIVHPGEIRIDPDGKVSMTPDAPETLTYGKRGTRIIPADEVNRMMYSQMMKQQAREIETGKTDELLEALLQASHIQIAAMKKKQPIHNHIHINTRFENHIDNAVRR